MEKERVSDASKFQGRKKKEEKKLTASFIPLTCESDRRGGEGKSKRV